MSDEPTKLDHSEIKWSDEYFQYNTSEVIRKHGSVFFYLFLMKLLIKSFGLKYEKEISFTEMREITKPICVNDTEIKEALDTLHRHGILGYLNKPNDAEQYYTLLN